jgi:hypothetical protein
MAKQERPRQRLGQRQTSRVPLTFYRARDASATGDSPFKKKEAPVASRLARFLAGLLDVIIILALLALLLYGLFVNDNPKVEVNSEVYHSVNAYKAAAHKYLSSVKNRNKITFNEQSIVAAMQKQFPEILNASVELPVMAETPVVHIDIANPSFILKSGASSYVVASNGVAVATVDQLPSVKNLSVVTDQSGFNAHASQQVMTAASVEFINDLIVQMKHANVTIDQIVLPPLAQELYLRAAGKPYFVKFYLGGDVKQQVGQFLAAIHQFDATNTQPSEYLDVRVPGKVFYK